MGMTPARAALAALGGRSDLTARTWIAAAAVGVVVAAGTFLASHASLTGDRAGIGGATVFLPAVLLFVVGFVSLRSRGHSPPAFRSRFSL